MKKTVLSLVLLLCATLSAYAVEKEFTSDTGNTGSHTAKIVNQDGQSNFQALGASGTSKTGNAGYLTLMATDNAGRNYPYYLWIDGSTGNVCVASYPTISTYSSFPSGDWRGTTGLNCPKVGAQ